jgi:hypothetical protein
LAAPARGRVPRRAVDEEQTMTEQEWFGSNDFGVLVRYAIDVNPRGAFRTGRTPRRKLRLASCAIARSIVALAADERTRIALETAERCAEGELPETDRIAMREITRTIDRVEPVPADCANAAIFHALGDDPGDLILTADLAWGAINYDTEERLLQIDILRDIVCNPFRPMFFSDRWRTDTAVTLAQQMYEARDFSAMPILADALQDAGCDDEHILTHCRDPHATHVRGCWVVDLVLGKS